MFQRILVPLDGSETAERALPVAARIARATGGTIVFVRVVLPPVEFGTYSAERIVALKPTAFEARLAEAESYLKALSSRDDLAGIKTGADLVSGAASPAIFSIARSERVDLIVMCSHGETGLRRWVFSSIAQQAVRHSPVPVLALNEHGVSIPEPNPAHPLHILVPLDGSTLSETALEPAMQLLAALYAPVQSELHLLRVVDLPSAYGRLKSQAHISDSMQEQARQEAETYVKAVADRLRAQTTLTITSSVAVDTDVAEAIIKLAEHATSPENTGSFDVIAMTTHGHSGLGRLVMGSVTEHVLGATRLPLLIVRPHAMEARSEKAGETRQAEKPEVEEHSWVGLL
jgi:nucleotide-binding universal stress UspA family protein